MFINAGLNKFFNYIPTPPDLPEKMQELGAAFGEIGWLMPLTGIAEVLGGLLFIFPGTRPLGAIVIFPILIGIVLTSVFAMTSALPMAIVLLAVDLGIIYLYREKYLPMVTNLRSRS